VVNGIAAGLVVVYGFLTGKRLASWNTLFLVMTILTGFFFRFHGIVLGVVSPVVMALALVARCKKWTEPIPAVAKVGAVLVCGAGVDCDTKSAVYFELRGRTARNLQSWRLWIGLDAIFL
jgi:hypothetical protein